MNHAKPVSSAIRRRRSTITAALLISAVLTILAIRQSPEASSTPEPLPDAPRTEKPMVEKPVADQPVRGPHRDSVFDSNDPEIANLDPDLLEALRAAADDAGREAIEFTVTSGWRSAEHQEQLLRDAIAKYGSEAEAARWVATPKRSEHVSGDAVDLGHANATKWLSQHGAAYGLCQIYRNEPWHFELRPKAKDEGCPAMYDDPTHDPRMQ